MSKHYWSAQGISTMNFVEGTNTLPKKRMELTTEPVKMIKLLVENYPNSKLFASLWKSQYKLSEKQIECIKNNYDKLRL